MRKKKLIMIGNGMAGIRLIEEMLKRDPNLFDVTIYGKEPHLNYNRIQLSNVLQGNITFEETILNDLSWYESNHIQLFTGETITQSLAFVQ